MVLVSLRTGCACKPSRFYTTQTHSYRLMVQLPLLRLVLEYFICGFIVKRRALFNLVATLLRAEKRGKIMSINLQIHHLYSLKYIADFKKL
jgi:hypothetical protein